MTDTLAPPTAAAGASLRGTAEEADPARPSTLESSWAARVLGAVEDLGWLERGSELTAELARPLTERQRLFDLLLGRPLGHALHPALTNLPLGLWAGAVVCDAAGDDGAAALQGAAGCASAVATAATGVAVYAIEGACSHAGGPLCEGTVERGTVEVRGRTG